MMRPIERWALVLAALNGLMAVAGGAMGAHGVADPDAKALIRTGAEYQLAHAAAALAVRASGLPAVATILALFGLGGLTFALSLDVLALTGLRVFGLVTPIGGLLMILGWARLAYGAARGA